MLRRREQRATCCRHFRDDYRRLYRQADVVRLEWVHQYGSQLYYDFYRVRT